MATRTRGCRTAAPRRCLTAALAVPAAPPGHLPHHRCYVHPRAFGTSAGVGCGSPAMLVDGGGVLRNVSALPYGCAVDPRSPADPPRPASGTALSADPPRPASGAALSVSDPADFGPAGDPPS